MPATFLSRKDAAAELGISVDTFDLWVKDGFLPGPAIQRGQTHRWHWPTVERHLLEQAAGGAANDPYMVGVRNASLARR